MAKINKCVDVKHAGHAEFREVAMTDDEHLFIDKQGELFIAHRCLVCVSCPVTKALGMCTACISRSKPEFKKKTIKWQK